MDTKYVFVTGGVTSSLGKGIISASLAKLLQRRGYRVTIQKFDPYLNVDPGTMNPYEHGECYVTDDGAETDLDLGHYERFLNVPTSQANNVTTGRVYQTVIENEREGKYLGKTVQIIPHVTDEIQRRMKILGNSGEYDIVITELGGTVGDIESLPYVESVRQLKRKLGADDSVVIHLTLIPYLSAAGELKTKPTQHSVQKLLEAGVQPDILVCRTEHKLTTEVRKKISLFCNVNQNAVIESIDVETIYDVPLMMENAVIEFARNVVGLTKAHSTEMAKTSHPVIDLMDSQKEVSKKGGTMRLGAYKCKLEKGSRSFAAYGKQVISERHRHRYEFNNEYLHDFETNGMMATGINPDNNLVEVVEIPNHPWFVGVQYHPELKSTVDEPHPLFVRFVKAAIENSVKK
ncbi:MAG: CTP synthase [Bacteroidetes bacterium]|nr:CTP synthase [Bacteroidota bacterium]